VALRPNAYYGHSAPSPSPQPQVAQPMRADGGGSHVRTLLLCGRVRLPLMPVRLTHNRRRSPMAHSPKASGVHPCVWAFGATRNYSRYTSSPTIPIIWRSVFVKGMSPRIPARSHTGLRPEDALEPMGWAPAPLLPLGFRQLLPPCPPPARLASGDVGASPLLLRASCVQRFTTHASWRT
jgi:hypothetical protein